MLYDEKIVERFLAKVERCTHGYQCPVCCWEWRGAAGRGSCDRACIPNTCLLDRMHERHSAPILGQKVSINLSNNRVSIFAHAAMS